MRYFYTTFIQGTNENDQFYIGEKPQLNLGGRSILWSGFIPTPQIWELDFFPPGVKADLMNGLLEKAGSRMNESASMGATAKAKLTIIFYLNLSR